MDIYYISKVLQLLELCTFINVGFLWATMAFYWYSTVPWLHESYQDNHYHTISSHTTKDKQEIKGCAPATSGKFRIFAAYHAEVHTGLQNLLPCSQPLKNYQGACSSFPNIKVCGRVPGVCGREFMGGLPQIP